MCGSGRTQSPLTALHHPQHNPHVRAVVSLAQNGHCSRGPPIPTILVFMVASQRSKFFPTARCLHMLFPLANQLFLPLPLPDGSFSSVISLGKKKKKE